MAVVKGKVYLAVAVLVLLLSPLFALPVLGGDSVFIQEGKLLYEKHCAGCHGDVDDSAKTGRSMNRIRSAIRAQPQHRPLVTLTDEEILLIAMALKEGSE